MDDGCRSGLPMDELIGKIEAEFQVFALASLSPAPPPSPPLLAWVSHQVHNPRPAQILLQALDERYMQLSSGPVGLFKFWTEAKKWANNARFYAYVRLQIGRLFFPFGALMLTAGRLGQVQKKKPEGNAYIAPTLTR